MPLQAHTAWLRCRSQSLYRAHGATVLTEADAGHQPFIHGYHSLSTSPSRSAGIGASHGSHSDEGCQHAHSRASRAYQCSAATGDAAKPAQGLGRLPAVLSQRPQQWTHQWQAMTHRQHLPTARPQDGPDPSQTRAQRSSKLSIWCALSACCLKHSLSMRHRGARRR